MNKGFLSALCLLVLVGIPACCWKKDTCEKPCAPKSCVKKAETVCEERCEPVQPIRRVKTCTTTTCGPVEYPCGDETSNDQPVKTMKKHRKAANS